MGRIPPFQCGSIEIPVLLAQEVLMLGDVDEGLRGLYHCHVFINDETAGHKRRGTGGGLLEEMGEDRLKEHRLALHITIKDYNELPLTGALMEDGIVEIACFGMMRYSFHFGTGDVMEASPHMLSQ